MEHASVADDYYTEFNPDYPTRIDGKAMATRMAEVPPYERASSATCRTAKVQTSDQLGSFAVKLRLDGSELPTGRVRQSC